MNITKKVDGNLITLEVEGRLDTKTNAQLAEEFDTCFALGNISLILVFSKLEYISSAGLRVLLTAQKRINSLGTSMKITGCSGTVKEIFDVTGFSSILEIE